MSRSDAFDEVMLAPSVARSLVRGRWTLPPWALGFSPCLPRGRQGRCPIPPWLSAQGLLRRRQYSEAGAFAPSCAQHGHRNAVPVRKKFAETPKIRGSAPSRLVYFPRGSGARRILPTRRMSIRGYCLLYEELGRWISTVALVSARYRWGEQRSVPLHPWGSFENNKPTPQRRSDFPKTRSNSVQPQ